MQNAHLEPQIFAALFPALGFLRLSFSLSYPGAGGRKGERPALAPFPRSAPRVRWLSPTGVTAAPRRCRSRPAVRCLSAPRPGRPEEAGAAPRPMLGAWRSGCRRPPCSGPARSRGILLVSLLPASLKALLINEEKHLPFVW